MALFQVNSLHIFLIIFHASIFIEFPFLLHRRVVYGKNEIAVPMKSIFSLLFLEVLNPFYVFQLFSFALWFADDYTSYAMAIAAMSVFSITGAIIQTRKVS